MLTGRARSWRSDGLVALDALGGFVLVIIVMRRGASRSRGRRPISRTSGRCGRATAAATGRCCCGSSAACWPCPLFDNLGLVWVAIEATTIVSALLVGFARTPAAIEAAWKYLILGSVGIGFALLGTLLAYASSVELLGETSDALAWTRLMAVAPELDPGLDAPGVHLRARRLRDQDRARAVPHVAAGRAQPGAEPGLGAAVGRHPGGRAVRPRPVPPRRRRERSGRGFSSTLLVAFGLLSLAVALPFIVAQGDLKRLLAYSSIEHMGLGALALGFGGPIALGGLALHLLAHGLTKASLFVSGGGLVERGRSRRIARLSRQPGTRPGRRAGVPGRCRCCCPACRRRPCSSASRHPLRRRSRRAGAGRPALAALLLALAVAGFLFHVGRVRASDRRRGAPRPPAAAARRWRAR